MSCRRLKVIHVIIIVLGLVSLELPVLSSQNTNLMPRVILYTDGTITYANASYIIYTDGTKTYAENGTTGTIDYWSTDPTAAINNVIIILGSAGGVIHIMPGVYGNVTSSQTINPAGKSNIVLEGEGDSTVINSICINVGDNWVVRNLKCTGNPIPAGILISAWSRDVENVTCQNVLFDSLGMSTAAAVEAYIANQTVQNLKFIDCKAVNCSGYGWWFEPTPVHVGATVKDVWLTNCEATNCGRYGNYSDWVSGIDFENVDLLENIFITDCKVEGSWEDGFHFEFAPKKSNIILSNCISVNNSQKRADLSDMYGDGYIVSGGMSLENCLSQNNKFGFWLYAASGTAISVADCVDVGSNQSIRIGASSGDIFVDNFESKDAQLGLTCWSSSNIHVTNFQIINATGDGGSGAADKNHITHLGEGDYPVSNSEFDLRVRNCNGIVFGEKGSNITLSGFIATNQTDGIEWDGGDNILYRDLTIFMASGTAGNRGIYEYSHWHTFTSARVENTNIEAKGGSLMIGIDGQNLITVDTKTVIVIGATTSFYNCLFTE